MFKSGKKEPLEHSCGAVLYTRIDDVIHYVIIETYTGSRGFPKGHIEAGETEEETALREIREEVGIRATLIPGFREEDEYPLPNARGTRKHVTYFLAVYSDQTIVPQDLELENAFLMPFEEAYAAIRFENARKILKAADDFIRGREAGLLSRLSGKLHLAVSRETDGRRGFLRRFRRDV